MLQLKHGEKSSRVADWLNAHANLISQEEVHPELVILIACKAARIALPATTKQVKVHGSRKSKFGPLKKRPTLGLADRSFSNLRAYKCHDQRVLCISENTDRRFVSSP